MMNKQRGFTLIEVGLYVALLVILLGGGIMAAYNIIESTIFNQTKSTVYNEGNFLLSKINWEVSGSSAISAPAPGTPGSVLTLTKSDSSTVTLKLVGTDMVIVRGSAAPVTLNNNTVQISDLSFDTQISSISQSVATSFTVSARTDDGKIFSQSFSGVKYLRK